MKDNDNMVRCDSCGLLFPASLLSPHWGWTQICVPCDDAIALDTRDFNFMALNA